MEELLEDSDLFYKRGWQREYLFKLENHRFKISLRKDFYPSQNQFNLFHWMGEWKFVWSLPDKDSEVAASVGNNMTSSEDTLNMYRKCFDTDYQKLLKVAEEVVSG